MFLNELAERRVIVVFCGRFQPFHLGHAKVYSNLVGTYGRNNVYIGTSGKVDPPDSPFTLSDRVYFMNLMGIPSDRILQLSNNYNTEAVATALGISDLSNTVIIFPVSQKDIEEKPGLFSGGTKKDGSLKKLQPLPQDQSQVESADKHAYIQTVKVQEFNVLGHKITGATSIRDLYTKANEPQRQQIIKDLYGRYTTEAEKIMNAALEPKSVQPPTPQVANKARLQKVKAPRAEPVQEGLPAKNQAQLYAIKHALQAQQAQSQAPQIAPKPEPSQANPQSLAALRQKQDKVNKLIDLKGKIDAAKENLSKKFGGQLPPGVEADLEDYYTIDDIDTHFPEMLASYEKQLKLISDLIQRRKGLFKRSPNLITGVKRTVASESIYKKGYVPGAGAQFEVGYTKESHWITIKLHQTEQQAIQHAKNIKKKYPGMQVGVKSADGQIQPIGLREEAVGVGVVAKNKSMAQDPRYSTSMTVDVHPNSLKKNLQAFNLAETEVDTNPAETERNWRRIQQLNSILDEIKTRLATEKLSAHYREELKKRIAQIEKERVAIALGRL